MLKTDGGQHALAFDPYNNIIYEVNHPTGPDGKVKNGMLSWLTGGPKSVGYQWNMSNPKQAAAFWSFNGGRGELQLAPVSISDPAAATAFFAGQTGETWDYNLFTNNCKNYAIQGFQLGGAQLNTGGPYPANWTNSQFIGYWNSSMAGPTFVP